MNILIADDDPISCRLLESIVNKIGFEAVTVDDGDKALKILLSESSPKIAILDWMMPEIDGIEVCRKIREEQQSPYKYIILVTSKTEKENIIEGMKSGADDYITKPFSVEELTVRINAGKRIIELQENLTNYAMYQSQLRQELEIVNNKIIKEIQMASIVQQSLLPKIKETIQINYWKNANIHVLDEKYVVTGYYLPSAILGGDFYDIIEDENKLNFTIADVSGHGLSSALITALFKMSLNRFLTSYREETNFINFVCQLINNDLCRYLTVGDYITAFIGSIDKKTETLYLSSAGHPYPLYYNSKNNTLEPLESNGPPFGIMENIKYPLKKIKLSPGDKILLFTDGISEAHNQDGEMFKVERLKQTLLDNINLQSSELISKINEELFKFTKTTKFEDDISMLLIDIR